MKSVLYITQKPHFPIVDGGTQAIDSFLNVLQKVQGIDITFAPICTKKHPGTLTKLPKNIEFVPLNIDTNIKIKHIILALSKPLNVLRYQDKRIEQKLSMLNQAKPFEIVVCDGFYALSIVPPSWFSQKKIIYRSHNLEYQHWELRAKQASFANRILLELLAKKMKKYETRLLNQVTAILSISAYETQLILSINANCQTFYPTITLQNSTPEVASNYSSIGFVGNFDWSTNRQAIDWFIANVWDHVRSKNPTLHFEIAGKGSSAYTNEAKHITGFEFLADLNAFYARQQLIVSPLPDGTGLNMKILDAIAHYKRIIASPASVKSFKEIGPIIVAEDAPAFIEQVNYALSQNSHLSTNSKMAHHEWMNDFTGEQQLEQLEKLIYG